MTQLETERHSFLSQRSRRPVHRLRNIDDRHFAFRVGFEFAQVLFRPRLTGNTLGFLRHHLILPFHQWPVSIERTSPQASGHRLSTEEIGQTGAVRVLPSVKDRMRREIRDVRAIDPPLIEKKLNGHFWHTRSQNWLTKYTAAGPHTIDLRRVRSYVAREACVDLQSPTTARTPLPAFKTLTVQRFAGREAGLAVGACF
jgi:hypothetical protein